jgi:hypothetical protein
VGRGRGCNSHSDLWVVMHRAHVSGMQLSLRLVGDYAQGTCEWVGGRLVGDYAQGTCEWDATLAQTCG